MKNPGERKYEKFIMVSTPQKMGEMGRGVAWRRPMEKDEISQLSLLPLWFGLSWLLKRELV